jgi:hypothetical protein
MTDADDMAARTKQLAKDILEELDAPVDPERVAYEAKKDRDDREALERFYVATGQKQPAPAGDVIVAAWDYSTSGDDLAFGLYAAGSGGAKLVEYTKVPAARRDATTASLRRRGTRIGGMYGGHPLVWAIDAQGFALWSKDAALPGVVASEVVAVVAIVEPDHVRRAVEVVRAHAAPVVVAEERDEIAMLDPTYSHDDLMMSDARWVSCLGRDLAAWLCVPLRDEVFGATIDPAIARGLRDLADRIDGLPAVGAFDPIEVRLPAASLYCAPAPAAPEHVRIVELRGGGKTRELASGANDEIAAHLRRADAVDEVAAWAKLRS